MSHPLPFVVFNYLSNHCAIDDDDDESVVLTGGTTNNIVGGQYQQSKKVTKYNANGEATLFPSLKVGRSSHACGNFINANQEMVSIMMDYYYLKFPYSFIL